MVAYPYAFGSTLYTWGAYCSVLASLQFLKSMSSSPAAIAAGKAMRTDQGSLRMAMQPGISVSPVKDEHSASFPITVQNSQPRPGWRNLVPAHLHEWSAGLIPDSAWAHVDLIGRFSLTYLLRGPGRIWDETAPMCFWCRHAGAFCALKPEAVS